MLIASLRILIVRRKLAIAIQIKLFLLLIAIIIIILITSLIMLILMPEPPSLYLETYNKLPYYLIILDFNIAIL